MMSLMQWFYQAVALFRIDMIILSCWYPGHPGLLETTSLPRRSILKYKSPVSAFLGPFDAMEVVGRYHVLKF